MPNKVINNFTLNINNTNNTNEKKNDILGLTLDTYLNWKKRTEKISSNCCKIVGILNILKYVLHLQITISYIIH